jgi:integrase
VQRGKARYRRGLEPRPSLLRPKVLASERLVKWLPLQAMSPKLHSFQTPADLDRRKLVMEHGWDASTLSTYGWGLLLYHVWCDQRGISDKRRTPIDMPLLTTFLADCSGSYSKSAGKNIVAALNAWSTLHSIEWSINHHEISKLLTGLEHLADDTCRREQRPPVLLEHLEKLAGDMNPDKPFDAAWFACALTAFWGTARLGELVLPDPDAFDPARHVKRADVELKHDRAGRPVRELRLPHTKVKSKDGRPKGETIHFAPRHGVANPEAAFLAHLDANDPPDDGPLFAFRKAQGSDERLPMTRHWFLQRLEDACKRLGLGELRGHSFRIGSALQYLLDGMTFEAVKNKGRWKSDAFQTYLREHGAVMAQYIQEPTVQRELIRVALPRPR